MPRRLALCLVALAGLVMTSPTVRAQPRTEPTVMRLAAISPWMDATRPFTAALQITNASELSLENVSVRATLHGRVFNRSQLRLTFEGRPQTGAIGSFALPLEPIPAGEGRRVVLERDPRELGAPPATGVYPVTITLSHSRGRQQIFTAVPYLGSVAEQRINVSWLLPVSRPTSIPPDGVYPADAVDELDLDGLAQQVDAIAARPGAPVTLAVNPSTLDLLADIADGYTSATPTGPQAVPTTSVASQTAVRILASFRRIAAGRAEFASMPYAPADLPTLARRGAPPDVARQIAVGRATLERHLGRAPTTGLLVPPGLSADGSVLQALRDASITGAIVDPALLVEQPSEPYQPDLFGPSRPIGFVDSEVRAALPDLPLRSILNGTERGVQLAQALIAETASAWLELPLFAPERLILLAGDDLPSPPALAAALDGLSTAPWVRALTASEALGALEPQGPPLQLRRLPRADAPYLAAARRARIALETLQAVTIDDFAGYDALERRVLLAESAEWAADPQAGVRLARAAHASARAITDSIEVAERRVTLTARTGSIPVTILYGGQGGGELLPLRVRVRVDSAKLGFPSGATQDVELRTRTMTLDFPVSARTAGTFPLDVVVETIDGSTVLTSGRLILRSSAVSAVTLAAVAGSSAFLLVAYVRRARRREGRARSRAAHPAGSARTPNDAGR